MRTAPHPLVAILTRVGVVLGLILLGAAVMGTLIQTAPKVEKSDAEAVRNVVQVYEPRAVSIRRQWRGYGTARALDTADVPTRITAIVTEIPDHVLDGAKVTRGQALVLLDPADYRGEIDRLKALIAEVDANLAQLDVTETRLTERLELEQQDLTIAREELERVRKLADRNVTSVQDVDRARSLELAARRALTVTRETLDALPSQRQARHALRAGFEAQLGVADLNLERTRIASPIDGVLQEVDVEVGEAVSPGQRVARVVDPTVIEVPVRLPAAARPNVRPGDPVRLSATNERSETWDARVARIAPEDDPQTRTVTVYALLDQQDTPAEQRLAPGVFVEAAVATGEPTPRVVVPRRALRKQRLQVVMPDANGSPVVTSRPVDIDYALRGLLPETGLADDQWAVLEDGALPRGATILVTATASVLDGEAVKTVAVGTSPGSAVAINGEKAPQRAPEASP